MQIYGYPGDRVDFVSKSGSAGSILFGDPRSLVEEFFGTPHTDSGDEVTYFNGSITVAFADGKVESITVTPGTTREKVEVYLGHDKLNGLTELADAPGVSAVFSPELTAVTFR
ncbi:hypothetical protein [Corynebacterium sp. SA-MJD20WY100]|uniref:hypothetical protein n=1 Tax=Corynebacterium sp. SA-MJD20WY100 TaxID=3142969 RepID=UPI0032217186